MQRAPPSEYMQSLADAPDLRLRASNGHAKSAAKSAPSDNSDGRSPGLLQLVICVGGIYASLYVSSPPRVLMDGSDRR